MKIKSYDEVAASVLSPEYVLANGILFGFKNMNQRIFKVSILLRCSFRHAFHPSACASVFCRSSPKFQ